MAPGPRRGRPGPAPPPPAAAAAGGVLLRRPGGGAAGPRGRGPSAAGRAGRGGPGRGGALRGLALRARLADGGSWARDLTLREATADPDRLALAALPRLAEITAPVTELWIGGDASGALAGHQLTAIPSPAEERRARAREAIRQVRAAQGPQAMLRAVEIEPWSRLPERRWALTPHEP